MKRNDLEATHNMSTKDLQQKLAELYKQLTESRLKNRYGSS